MDKYFRTVSAAHVYLIRENNGKQQVCLALRAKSLLGGGQWDPTGAGHLERDETFTQNAQRELLEEAGVTFNPKDIKFMTLIHNRCSRENSRAHIHFFVDKWNGEPRIIEADKCDEMRWFDIDNLPNNMSFDRREAIENYLNKIAYSEKGW